MSMVWCLPPTLPVSGRARWGGILPKMRAERWLFDGVPASIICLSGGWPCPAVKTGR